MKPSLFSPWARALTASVFACFAGSVSADTIYWDGTGITPNNFWSTVANWSTVDGNAASNPAAAPGAADVISLGYTGVTTTQTIRLDANQSVLGIASANSTILHSLIGDGTNRTLTIGDSGINHLRGGLTIGSTTEGQKVDILLGGTNATQTWTSSTAGAGSLQAVFVHNNVTLATATNKTLILDGINTGTFINGVISDGTAGGVLSLQKNGSGTWMLGGTNTYTGTTTVNAGLLRLTTTGAVTNKAGISVNGTATLSLRTGTGGTGGFSVAEIDAIRSTVTFASTAFLGLDTTNNGFDYTTSLTNGVNYSKYGGNTLTLSGNNNAFTGTLFVSEGFLAFNNVTNLTGGTISVGGSGTVLALAGGSGFTTAQLDSLRNSLVYAAGGSFGVSTVNGDFNYASVMGGTIRFTKSGLNTLYVGSNNTYSGGTVVTSGTLAVEKMANGGTASSIGSSTNIATNLTLAGGRLPYIGSGDTTNRLFHLTGTSTIDSSGTGALVFSNTGSNTAAGGSRTLTLTGYNTGANTIAGAITNTENTTNLIKTGYGNWTLSGANSYTGTTRVRGGTLTFDYATADPLSSNAAKNVYANTGTVQFKAGAFSSSDTLGILTLGESQNGLATVKLSGGMALTVAALDGSSNSQRHNLIDLSGGSNSLVVTKVNSSTTAGTNEHLKVTADGLILNNANTLSAGRANIVVRANDGTYGFAAFAAGSTSGAIQKLGNLTSVSASATVTDNTKNYLVTAGSYTTSATTNFSTMTFDSTGGAINFALASGHTLNSSATGKAMLFYGGSDVAISGGHSTTTGISALWLHNYLDESATLNLGVNWGNTVHLIVGGTGFTNYTGIGLGMSAGSDFVLNGGTFRVGADQNITANSGAIRINDAVFEVGADLNGATTGDLTANSANFRLTGNSGLSAYTAADGGVRTVSFTTDLTWGTNNFLVNAADTTDGDYALKLSSLRSNATIDITSNINLNGRRRTVDVANGSASVDARLSGVLSGGLSSGLSKVGAGTLELTGTNTYQGSTLVEGGRLVVGGGGINSTTSVHVRNSTLELTASNVVNDAANITLENAFLRTNGTTEIMGALTIIGDNQLNLQSVGNVIRFADSSAVVWSSTLAILDWAGLSTGGGQDQVYFGSNSNGLTSSQLSKITFVNPTLDGQSYTGTYGAAILSTGEIVAVIPEPSLASLGLIGAGAWFFRRRREA